MAIPVTSRYSHYFQITLKTRRLKLIEYSSLYEWKQFLFPDAPSELVCRSQNLIIP